MDRAVDNQAEHETIGEDAGAAEHALHRHQAELREQVADEFGVQAWPPQSVCAYQMREGAESGLDRLDGTLFVLAFLSRIADRRRRGRFAPSLTRTPTRTTSIQEIHAG